MRPAVAFHVTSRRSRNWRVSIMTRAACVMAAGIGIVCAGLTGQSALAAPYGVQVNAEADVSDCGGQLQDFKQAGGGGQTVTQAGVLENGTTCLHDPLTAMGYGFTDFTKGVQEVIIRTSGKENDQGATVGTDQFGSAKL